MKYDIAEDFLQRTDNCSLYFKDQKELYSRSIRELFKDLPAKPGNLERPSKTFFEYNDGERIYLIRFFHDDINIVVKSGVPDNAVISVVFNLLGKTVDDSVTPSRVYGEIKTADGIYMPRVDESGKIQVCFYDQEACEYLDKYKQAHEGVKPTFQALAIAPDVTATVELDPGKSPLEQVNEIFKNPSLLVDAVEQVRNQSQEGPTR